VFEEQAGLIRDNWKFTRYSTVATNQWNELVVAGLKRAARCPSCPAYGEELKEPPRTPATPWSSRQAGPSSHAAAAPPQGGAAPLPTEGAR
jgi:hypothetical protein